VINSAQTRRVAPNCHPEERSDEGSLSRGYRAVAKSREHSEDGSVPVRETLARPRTRLEGFSNLSTAAAQAAPSWPQPPGDT